MEVKKKTAALIAASKNSTNPLNAISEYLILTGQQASTQEDWQRCYNEMLSFLPRYRHPMDVFVEHMIFIDPEGIGFSGTILSEPPFLTTLRSQALNEKIFAEIKQYVHEAESDKIALSQHKENAENLQTAFDQAQSAFSDSADKRSSTRNARVVQALGLSNGVPAKRINAKEAYETYIIHRVRRQGLSRKEAVFSIKKEFDIASDDATLHLLHKSRADVLLKWETIYPNSLPVVREYLAKLIPYRG